MRNKWSRRDFVKSAGKTAAIVGVGRKALAVPSSPVSVARCTTYEPRQLTDILAVMFDQIGGIGSLAKGKTIGIKINMTGVAVHRCGHRPIEETTWTHPNVVAATMHLLDKAGARRIRILESPWKSGEPLEEVMYKSGWDPAEFTRAAARVELENTNLLGAGRKYHRVTVPHGGFLFPAFDLNHSYVDCDSFISIAKLKEHHTTGITLAMKNCFGITPCTIYGDAAGEDEPSLIPTAGRGQVIHQGARGPSRSAPQEVDPDSPREGEYRVPRCIVDLAAARPIDLSIIDGITAQAVNLGTRGVIPTSPGLLAAGKNPVSTDSVGAAAMGFDPMADRGQTPFEYCDSTLRLAEDAGLGIRDLNKIEMVGTPVREVVCDYRAIRKAHGFPPPRAPRRR